MENSPGAEEANYYGHYPYEIEGNYFSQENLATKPGEYRQTTVEVDSFSPNPWGLYNMHGNVGEWTWDIYGAYPDGQSLAAIAKLAPDAQMGEGLSVHYSGGNSLPDDVAEWLEENGIGESDAR